MMMGNQLHRQHGLAVVTVMLILALMATLAAFMLESEHIAIRKTSNAVQAEQGYQSALTGEQWALAVLRKDLEDDLQKDQPAQLPVNDHLNEDWVSLKAPPVSIPDTEVSIAIIDESARFNLNNLLVATPADRKPVEPDENGEIQLSDHQVWMFAFQGLLQSLGLDDQLRFALEEWLDADTDQQRISEMAAEDNEYQSEDPPYRAANRLIEDLSELRLIKGFDDKAISKLRPFVTVLPSYGARMNANTVDAHLFQTIFRASGGQPEFVSSSDADTLEQLRGDNGIANFEQSFLEALPALGLDPRRLFGEKSRYFRIISRTTIGGLSYGIESLVRRSEPAQNENAPASVPQTEIVVEVLQRRRTLG